jgi:lysophospholipase L1-like esterase
MTAKKPRILLLGDSIRMAYAPLVRERLQGKAEVLDVSENCEDSHKYLKRLQKWLKKADAANLDIIHFNCGLHDIKRKFKSIKNQQSIEKYQINLIDIIAQLRKNSPAKLIWATTTPVIYELHHKNKGFDRFEADVLRYNNIATKIMEDHQIPINNLNQIIEKNSPETCIREDGVHMTEKGNNLLAEAVSAFLIQMF